MTLTKYLWFFQSHSTRLHSPLLGRDICDLFFWGVISRLGNIYVELSCPLLITFNSHSRSTKKKLLPLCITTSCFPIDLTTAKWNKNIFFFILWTLLAYRVCGLLDFCVENSHSKNLFIFICFFLGVLNFLALKFIYFISCWCLSLFPSIFYHFDFFFDFFTISIFLSCSIFWVFFHTFIPHQFHSSSRSVTEKSSFIQLFDLLKFNCYIYF